MLRLLTYLHPTAPTMTGWGHVTPPDHTADVVHASCRINGRSAPLMPPMSPMSSVMSDVMSADVSATAVSPRRCKRNRVEREGYGRYEKSPQNDCRQFFHRPAPLI